jgi:pyridinium-3,5-biscarboxylic acid mononucleotide sulfurtransferase
MISFDSSKYAALIEILKSVGPVAVAYSGGVDSSFLLRAAATALNNDIIAITARSATTPQQEYEDASEFTRLLGIRHFVVDTHEMTLSDFTDNRPDRCYICKKYRYQSLMRIAAQYGYSRMIDGENADDAADYRPGSRAARELGVGSPLREAGYGKKMIRTISQHLGLSTWNKPSMACLASRIPYHHPITVEKLKQIDRSETFIRNLVKPFQLRVRHFGNTARIEMDVDAMIRFMTPSIHDDIVSYLKELGFTHILLDLEGYRMGNLNP